MTQCDVDANYVLNRLIDIDQMDVLDIFDDAMENLLPLNLWPKAWRQSISSVEVNEIHDFIDGDKVNIGLLKKIKWPDKVKNLELIGKHTSIKAWDKDINLNGDGIEMHLHYGSGE